MRTYFKLIKFTQQALLGFSILTLMILPLIVVFYPDVLSPSVTLNIYSVAHIFLFFVMIIRPLADIFMGTTWIRPLVILRKGAGVLSASIIVSFILAKLMIDPATYVASLGTAQYWSFRDYAIFAHVADITAVILLVTSNNLSKRILGDWWKRIQKLAYIYFYSSALYVFIIYKDVYLLVMLVVVTVITLIASIKNEKRLALIQNQTQN